MKKIWILFTLLTLCIYSNAQNIISPGSPEIKTERIHPSHDFYKNVITGPDGKLLYEFMMENYQWLDSAKQQWVFARYRQVPRGYFSTDTSYTDLRLMPLHMHEIHFQQNVDIQMQFEAEKATVTTIRKGQSTTKTYAMTPGYFEDNMIEYLFGYLELKKGVTYKLDNFNPATSGSDPFTVTYSGDGDHSKVFTFTHGDTRGRIWIDNKTHQILRQEGQSPKWHHVVTKQ
ncbi:hypothetical protein FO440_09900 [Mucilaginibacter corticis]|uniref:DUF3108 domain-containing protein n=1 Tax=Mucilaginibacter corticis TaxID=2597670 RepID=A0A556MXB6_9SPHI|nr:hypothetical protein [Mucilaginibacter corticis]TSJ44468.1 hypothetical protein FO440_09900 [Mucilaginibacter corticis]